jgi:hypothetical protein
MPASIVNKHNVGAVAPVPARRRSGRLPTSRSERPKRPTVIGRASSAILRLKAAAGRSCELAYVTSLMNSLAVLARSLMVICSLTMLLWPGSSRAMQSRGGAGPTVPAGLHTVVMVGTLSISIDHLSVRTCFGRAKAGPATPTRSGWEWLDTMWVLRSMSDRPFALPHPNHPGFRLVGSHRLHPGFYARYPGYGAVVAPHTADIIPWTFAIRRGTRRVTLPLKRSKAPGEDEPRCRRADCCEG